MRMSLLKERNALIKKIALLEGKKVQVSIGNLREIFKILVDLEVVAKTSDQSPARIIASLASKIWAKKINKTLKPQLKDLRAVKAKMKPKAKK
jgi:predicted DNA-binding antitoxin AbrB/MazE fold protein